MPNTSNRSPSMRRPLNIVTAKGSGAERFFRERGGLPGVEEIESEAIAPGVRRSPTAGPQVPRREDNPGFDLHEFLLWGGVALGFQATFRISIKHWRRRCRIHT